MLRAEDPAETLLVRDAYPGDKSDLAAKLWRAAEDPSASADITAFPTMQDEHRRLIDATDEFMRAATKTVGAQLP